MSEKNLNRLIFIYSMPIMALLSIMCLIVGEAPIDFKGIWQEPYLEKGAGCIIIGGATFLWAAMALFGYILAVM